MLAGLIPPDDYLGRISPPHWKTPPLTLMNTQALTVMTTQGVLAGTGEAGAYRPVRKLPIRRIRPETDFYGHRDAASTDATERGIVDITKAIPNIELSDRERVVDPRGGKRPRTGLLDQHQDYELIIRPLNRDFGAVNEQYKHVMQIPFTAQAAAIAAVPCKLARCRVALEVVGRSLTTFQSPYEQVRAVRDAMQGHLTTYERAGLLHGDVSVNNIRITEGGGVLIGWDSNVDPNLGKTRPPQRLGTRLFLSAQISDIYQRHQTLLDELESAVFVQLWASLKYCPLNLTRRQYSEDLLTIFENRGPPMYCGQKVHFLSTHKMLQNAPFKNHPVLDRLLKELVQLFSNRYSGGKREQMEILQRPSCVVEILSKYLDNPEQWLPRCEAKLNPVLSDKEFGEDRLAANALSRAQLKHAVYGRYRFRSMSKRRGYAAIG